jgi:hypothetical protein
VARSLLLAPSRPQCAHACRTLRSLLLCCACCALLLALGLGGSAVQVLLLFMARGGIEGSFCTLYIYTQEVRASGRPAVLQGLLGL